jgi:hypothetical protein
VEFIVNNSTRSLLGTLALGFCTTMWAGEPDGGPPLRQIPAPSAPAPLALATGTHFTLVPLTLSDEKLGWVSPVYSAKVVPVTIYVQENGLQVPKTVDQTITIVEMKRQDVNVSDLEITNAKGKVVSPADVAKRFKSGSTLILLYNPLDDTTRKWFSDDALFFMPLREKGETRKDTGTDWTKLRHDSGTRITVIPVKTKDGELLWTQQMFQGKIVSTVEDGAVITRAEPKEPKVEEKTMKLADMTLTDAKGDAVKSADIEKRWAEGGVLVRAANGVAKADRALFEKTLVFVEPPPVEVKDKR